MCAVRMKYLAPDAGERELHPSLQEGEDGRRELLGPLHVRQVRGAWNLDRFGSGDLRHDGRGLEHSRLVVFAGDGEQRQAAQLWQALDGRRVQFDRLVLESGLALEQPAVHRADRRSQGRVHFRGIPPDAVHPDLELDLIGGIDVAGADEAVDLLEARHQLGRRRHAVGPGGYEDGPLDRLRILECELDRDRAAERDPHHRRAIEAGRMEHAEHIVMERVRGVGIGRLPEAAGVESDGREPLGERIPLWVPGGAVADPLVVQEQGRPVSRDLEYEPVHPGDARGAHSLITIAAVMNWASGPVG